MEGEEPAVVRGCVGGDACFEGEHHSPPEFCQRRRGDEEKARGVVERGRDGQME